MRGELVSPYYLLVEVKDNPNAGPEEVKHCQDEDEGDEGRSGDECEDDDGGVLGSLRDHEWGVEKVP